MIFSMFYFESVYVFYRVKMYFFTGDFVLNNDSIPFYNKALVLIYLINFFFQSRVSVNVCSTTNTDKKILTQIKKCTQQIILKPSEPKQNANKFVQCKPCASDEECQTGLCL